MTKKYPKSESIQTSTPENAEAYVMWGEDADSKNNAIKASSGSLEEFIGINKAEGSRRYGLDYSRLGPNTSGRPGLTRSDYYYFRPDEDIPTKIKDIIRRAEDVYQKVGLVKNVIDLMGDFAVQGIKLSHRNKRIERFYRQWFKKVSGKDRSERFLNNLYKTGNIVINRQTAKLSIKVVDKLYQSMGASDLTVSELDQVKIEKREVPWKYTFIDPFFVEVSAGALASFVSDKRYELVLPAHLRKIINSPKTDNEKNIIDGLPPQIIEAAKNKKPYPLDPDKTIVYHYKKDDWQAWSFPMIYAIMDDITVIEKLKLADMAALDGAISNIRIFKLGSLEHRIAPTKAATAKLASILGNNVGGGTMDLVWGPDIELIESKTTVHQFLGEGKYTPHLNSVYAGLGIPPTLTGTFGAAGTTNNFISLKTLTQRLQYGRKILTAFWKQEIAAVQKAMGFRFPAKVEFDRMDLSNEDAEKALLIQLADRNIISDELVQTAFGFDSDMEKVRVKREQRERDTDSYVPKSGPYYNPEIDNELRKISLQTGIVTPSEVGLELEKKKGGQKSAMDAKNEVMVQKQSLGPTKPAGVSGQGRPKNSKDSGQRQTKKFSPQTGASLQIWANEAQDKINEIMNPYFLEFYNKKNMRSLASEEYSEADATKSKLLFTLDPSEEINENNLIAKLVDIDNNKGYSKYKEYSKELASQMDRTLSQEELKTIKSLTFVENYNGL